MARLEITNIRSFNQLDNFLGNRSSKNIGYHTNLRRENGNLIVRQWNTDIYTLSPNDKATLRVDGWYTVTTKNRLNQLLPHPMRIWSEKGRWYLYTKAPQYDSEGVYRSASDFEGAVPFADGIQLNVTEGTVGSVPNHSAIQREDRENAKVKRQIASYVKGLTDEKVKELAEKAFAGEMGGDCWFCLLFERAENGTNRKVDNGHLLSHLQESYYMASLNINALQANGRNPSYNLSSGWDVRHAVGKFLRKRLLKGIAVA